MKKSTVFLTIAVLMAFTWSILICWFCAASINNYRKGKALIFAKSYTRDLEDQRKRFPSPSDEFIISGDGATSLVITQGKELTVLSNKHVFTCSYSDLKNGKSKVSFSRLFKDPFETIKITLPEIRMLSVDNCAEVILIGFNRKEMQITGSRIHQFSADSCGLGSLYLDLSENQPDYEIWIKGTNQLDSLFITTNVKGKLKLDGIGKYKNFLCVSNSVEILTRADLYKRLSIVSYPETQK